MSSRAVGGSSSSWRFGSSLSFILGVVCTIITLNVQADLYWVAPNGEGTWGGNNWSSSTSGTGGAWQTGTTALFHQSENNIDLNGESPSLYSLRPAGSGYSASNRRVVNIYNTSETDSTFTYKITGHGNTDFKNLIVTFGGERSTGKVNVYNSKNNGNTTDTHSLKLAWDSHVVFAANSEYTEAGKTHNMIGNNNAASNSLTVAGGKVTMNAGLRLGYYGSGSTGVVQIDSGEMSVIGGDIIVGETANNTGAVVLNGGKLTAKHLKGGAGAHSFVFNGGKLVAGTVSSEGLIASTLPVTVNALGGTIDNNGLDVSIGATIGGSGAMHFTGSGKTTLTGDNLSGNDTVVNDGNVIVSGRDTEITKSLTVNGGTLETDVEKWTKLSGGTINLNGGTFKARHIHKQSGSPVINFNGGILQATRDYAANGGLIQSGVTVNVYGGIIDSGEYAIVVGAALGGTGGLTFTGGNTIMLNGAVNYSGATAVTPGTILAVANDTAKSNILKNGLVVAGIPTVGQTIMTYTDGLTDEDISKVSCPLAPSTTFKIGEGGKSIVVDEVGEALANYWTGAFDNDLSKAANWSGGQVPTDDAIIYSAAPVTLTKGDDSFAPSSITFLEGSAKVTIEGDEISNVTAIKNLSGVRHVFNCAVSGNEIDFINTTQCCEFRGGITLATPIFANSPENAHARAIVGKWIITSDWSPVSYNELGRDDAIGSSITVQGEFLNPNNIVIYSGSVVTAATMKATSSTYPAYLNNGRLVINGLMDIANTSKDFSLARTDGDNATIIAGGIVFNTGKWPYLNAKTLVLGVDGIKFDSTKNNNLRFSGTPTLYASGVATTLHAGKDDLQAYSIGDGKTLTVCTTKFDSSEPSTITIDGKILETYNVTGHYAGGMAVTGCGTLVFNSESTFNGGLSVGGTATVKVNEGCTPGSGVITLGAGTKLVLTANSSTYQLPNTLNLPTEGVATIRIDGKRLRTGNNVIATIGSGATENVALDMNSAALDGRKATLRVEGGKLILNIQSSGFMIIVR